MTTGNERSPVLAQLATERFLLYLRERAEQRGVTLHPEQAGGYVLALGRSYVVVGADCATAGPRLTRPLSVREHIAALDLVLALELSVFDPEFLAWVKVVDPDEYQFWTTP